MLPSGAIPLAIVNFNTHQYFEVINSQEPDDILEWVTDNFQSENKAYINQVFRSDEN